MAPKIDGPARELLEQPHHAVVSTLNDDGTIHSAVVWIGLDDEGVLINSAIGRKWPTNLERDPQLTIVVYDQANPYEYVEIRGTAESTTATADDDINRLSKKYIGQDEYPFRQPGEERITFRVTPDRVRHQKQG